MPETQQVNDEETCSVMPAVQMENSHSTGYIMSAEWHRGHEVQASFLGGMTRSHKVGPGR